MTSPQVGGSKVSKNMLVSDVRQLLPQCCLCRFEGGSMCSCWALTAEDGFSRYRPSTGCGGSKVDFVCLEAAGTAVDDHSVTHRLLDSCSVISKVGCQDTVVALPFLSRHCRVRIPGKDGSLRRVDSGRRHDIPGARRSPLRCSLLEAR